MRVRHGGMSIDLPSAWVDRSVLLFTTAPEGEDLPTLARVDSGLRSVSINFLIPEGMTPKEILAAQAANLEETAAGFKILSEEPFECGLGKGWQQVQELVVNDTTVQQLTVACPMGEVVVMATAGADEPRFARAKAELLAILQSMQPAAGASE